jgi:hypothetical protein
MQQIPGKGKLYFNVYLFLFRLFTKKVYHEEHPTSPYAPQSLREETSDLDRDGQPL